MRLYRYLYLLILCQIFNSLYSQSSVAVNSKIKTVFIYNFTKYFEWPNWEKKSEFTIGLLGADSSIIKELTRLATIKKVRNLPIKLKIFKDVSELTYTELLYVDVAKVPKYKLDKKSKYTLVITENNSELRNAMIAFFMLDGNKQRFAVNEVNLKNAGFTLSDELGKLAQHKITGTNSKMDEAKEKEWRSVFDKFAEALANNTSEIKLSKQEAVEVIATIDANKKTIEEKEEKLKDQEKEIHAQQDKLSEQKSKIDLQLLSLLTQEEKLRLQEQKLELTIQQNKAQEADLEIAKQEVTLQQRRINIQRTILEDQKKDIDKQNEKLIMQLGQINSQRTILYLAAFLVIIIALALFIAYKGNKNKQRANALLLKQKLEIEQQRELVEEKQKEILDSINYAKRIQYSLLASVSLLEQNLSDHFLYFKPKDVVSGDFYWATKLSNDNFVFVTADSTGHGVPGAIMSMLNISCLNEAVNADKLIQPADIINATRKKVIQHLSNDGSEQGGKDGMDCSLVCFDKKNKKLIYSAANNPVWIVRDKKLITLAPDRMPVGKHDKDNVLFSQHEFDLVNGDVIYTLTDGFADQFGGPRGKKFKYSQLQELLISISDQEMQQQKKILYATFENWKGDLEQVDDVLIVGFKL